MKRRHFLAGSAALTLAAPSVRAAGNPKLLKFIPQADIALLDPDFTPALVTRNHAYMVYDTLYGVDDALHPRPQMAAGIPGSLAVYLRNADYVPRTDGPPSGTAGPKIANFDRVEWHTIPDPATAAAAIQAGEADWWEQATSDLLPLLRSDKNVRVEVIDSLGYHAVLRFNHLYPPFDNAGIRRALLGAFSQTDMMTAVAGDDRSMWKAGVGFFQPNSPCASDAGMEKLNSPRDLAQVKRDLAAAGYNGEKFVFLVPTDLPAINAMSEVAADIFRKLGMNMDYQTLDWATVAQRLNSQEPLDKGGWSLNANYAPGYAASSPAAHGFLRGLGRKSLFGWPTMPKLEALRSAWIDSTDPDEQKRLCREIQLQAFQDVPYIPLGAFFFASAYRSDLTGMLKGSVPMFTNLRRT